MVDDLISPNEAARILGITEAALSRFRHERRGPIFVKVGKLVRYSREDLLKWIEERRIQRLPEAQAKAE